MNTYMKRVLEVNEKNHTAGSSRPQGPDLENAEQRAHAVRHHPYLHSGHFPQS